MKDYYKILGVSRTATEKDIQSAFRKQSLRCHPDRLEKKDPSSIQTANEKMHELVTARDVLCDPIQRKAHDATLGHVTRHHPYSRPQSQAFKGQASQDQAFQGQAFQGQAFQGQAFQGQAFQGQAFQGQAFQGQAFQGQAFQGQPYRNTEGILIVDAITKAFFAPLLSRGIFSEEDVYECCCFKDTPLVLQVNGKFFADSAFLLLSQPDAENFFKKLEWLHFDIRKLLTLLPATLEKLITVINHPIIQDLIDLYPVGSKHIVVQAILDGSTVDNSIDILFELGGHPKALVRKLFQMANIQRIFQLDSTRIKLTLHLFSYYAEKIEAQKSISGLDAQQIDFLLLYYPKACKYYFDYNVPFVSSDIREFSHRLSWASEDALMNILHQHHSAILNKLIHHGFSFLELLAFHDSKEPSDRLSTKDRLFVLMRHHTSLISVIESYSDKPALRKKLLTCSSSNLSAIVKKRQVIIGLLSLGFSIECIKNNPKNRLLWKHYDKFRFLAAYSSEKQAQWHADLQKIYPYATAIHKVMSNPSLYPSVETLLDVERDIQLKECALEIQERVVKAHLVQSGGSYPMLTAYQNQNYHILLTSQTIFASERNPHPLKTLSQYLPILTLLQIPNFLLINVLLAHAYVFPALDGTLRKFICDNVVSNEIKQIRLALLVLKNATERRIETGVKNEAPILNAYAGVTGQTQTANSSLQQNKPRQSQLRP